MAQGESGFQKGRVSVVTPVYNGESHLRRMLDSVLEQTCQQVEMILVDDGSADGTVRIAEGYLEKFARRGYDFRIVKAEHKNASAAINQGLLLVTGEYLIWPDSDDVLEPESIKKRVEFLLIILMRKPDREAKKQMNKEGTCRRKSCSGIFWNPERLSAAAAIC